jgi:hypothetical protein
MDTAACPAARHDTHPLTSPYGARRARDLDRGSCVSENREETRGPGKAAFRHGAHEGARGRGHEPERLGPGNHESGSTGSFRSLRKLPLDPFDGHTQPALGRPEYYHSDTARPTHELGHEFTRGRSVQILWSSYLFQAAATEQRHPVAQVKGLVLLVGDEHGSDPHSPDQFADLAAGPLPEGRVQVGEWLVQKKDARLRGKGPCERHPLLLTSRQLADAAALVPRQIYQRERARHPAVKLFPTHAQGLQTKRHVLAHIEMREEGVVLKHHPKTASDRVQAGDVLSLYQYTTLVRDFEAREQPKGRGLPASTRTQQRQHLAALDRERQAIDGQSPVETLGEGVQLEEGQ